MKKFGVASLLGLALSLPAMAETNKPMVDQVSGQGYGAAGCGLGSIVFGRKTGFVQVFASTTNGSFGTQTFGISSGTSNCNDARGHASLFIKNNQHALANDAARGQGETIVGLTKAYGCTDSTSVGAALQKNYSRIFKNENADAGQIEKSIRTAIRHDAATCRI